jgi:hypothetical protein
MVIWKWTIGWQSTGWKWAIPAYLWNCREGWSGNIYYKGIIYPNPNGVTSTLVCWQWRMAWA